jgi:hypothetical protein
MKTFDVEYSSNNSGGDWWLDDEDWFALERAGWKVDWEKDKKRGILPAGPDGRWLGALAKYATLTVEAEDDARAEGLAIESWQQATHQDPDEEGCNCCGQPHWFSAREVVTA